MVTIVVYNENLYVLPPDLGADYERCHGCTIGESDSGREIYDLTEHLGYMLGEAGWYDGPVVPTLPEFLERIRGEETASGDDIKACPAPWSQFKIKGQTLYLLSGEHRVIVCGWVF